MLYFYDCAADGWVYLNKFVPDNEEDESRFGHSVATTTGELIVAGAPFRDEDGTSSGASFIFGPTCDADINKDGEVTVSDLIALIMAWGSCGGCTGCLGDVDLDGDVDVQDLVELILFWDTCVEQQAPQGFYDCVDNCSPTSPSCVTDCAERYDLID